MTGTTPGGKSEFVSAARAEVAALVEGTAALVVVEARTFPGTV